MYVIALMVLVVSGVIVSGCTPRTTPSPQPMSPANINPPSSDTLPEASSVPDVTPSLVSTDDLDRALQELDMIE